MTLVKTALAIPALVSGLWLASGTDAADRSSSTEARVRGPASTREASIPAVQAGIEEINEAVVSRRVRIERILLTLDRIAEIAIQMGPIELAWLEPVLMDLAEQTSTLISDEAIMNSETDGELNRIEDTVESLVSAIDRTVEPEMSL